MAYQTTPLQSAKKLENMKIRMAQVNDPNAMAIGKP